MLSIHTIDSQKSGKNLLIIGSIHGDEIAGSLGIERILADIKDGTINMNTGKITCIPYANWEAYKKNVRYIDHNANRLFNQVGHTPEHLLVEGLKKEIEYCNFLLDLHTYHYGNGSFLFDDCESEETKKLFDVIPVDQVILGWNDLYDGGQLGMDSTAYAKSLGIPASTVECGFHNDTNAITVAYESILNIGLTLGIFEGPNPVSLIQKKYIRMEYIIGKPNDGIFVKNWKHGDTIYPNEILYTIGDEEIKNGNDKKVMIIPFPDATTKDEWFYIGYEV